MANSLRTANSITRRGMGLCLAAVLLIAVLPTLALPQAREDIEWLDAWLPHSNEYDLPHVLLIGDSITRGYGPQVEKALAGRAYVGRLATSKSLGDPALLSEVELILQTNRVDVIHFNNGLHGAKYSEQEYAAALPALLAVFKRLAPNARLIWASSTGIVALRSPNELTQARISERNRLAAIEIAKQGIPIDDLFSVVKDHAEYHLADGVHFTPSGYDTLAVHVAATISHLLARQDCSGIAGLALADTTLQAQQQLSGPFQVPDPSPFVPDLGVLPRFCRVTAVIRPVPGSEIGVEIWLPAAWNRRMLQVGNGGFAGAINYAGLAGAIKQGFVGVSTDDGHRAPASVTPTAVWSIGHPERIVDFGHRAVHLASVAAKAVIRHYFGDQPDHSYFSGCSDGGREALISAQRNPEDFDGWAVGAPANAWTSLMTGFVYASRQVESLPKPAFSASALEAISRSALEQCDALDGIKDGVIGQPGDCRFDPRRLACNGAASGHCLSAGQAEVVANIYRGPTFGGTSIPGYADTVGAENAWAVWLTGPVPAGFSEPSVASFGRAYFAQMVYQQAGRDLAAIPLSKLFADGRAGPGREVDAIDPDLKRVRTAGKKIIQYHGNADAAIPAEYSRRYYTAVQKYLGGQISDFYRLFLMPGVLHCTGGPGADTITADDAAVPFDADHDVVAALVAWVESGKAPERLIATHLQVDGSMSSALATRSTAKVQFTRPLCVYPKHASWNGSGSPDEAISFDCR